MAIVKKTIFDSAGHIISQKEETVREVEQAEPKLDEITQLQLALAELAEMIAEGK